MSLRSNSVTGVWYRSVIDRTEKVLKLLLEHSVRDCQEFLFIYYFVQLSLYVYAKSVATRWRRHGLLDVQTRRTPIGLPIKTVDEHRKIKKHYIYTYITDECRTLCLHNDFCEFPQDVLDLHSVVYRKQRESSLVGVISFKPPSRPLLNHKTDSKS